jgi:predicted porin
LEKLEMKKTLVALAALASVSAFAQSTVTLTGNLDVAGTNYGGTMYGNKGTSFTSGYGTSSTSSINFNAVEDLGGGTSVAVRYELDPRTLVNDGFAVTNSTRTDISGATTYAPTAIATGIAKNEIFVGITGGFGSVKLGSPNTVGLDIHSMSSPLGTGIGSGYSLVGNSTTMWQAAVQTRYDRSIRYDAPTMNGITATVGYAPGNDEAAVQNTSSTSYAARSIPNNRTYTELGLRYANGPLNIGWANVSRTAQTNPTGWLAMTASTSGLTSTFGYVATKTNTLGVNYNLGATTLYYGWVNGDSLASTSTQTKAQGNRLAAKQNMGSMDLTLQLNTLKSTSSAGVATTAKVSGIRLDNNLSKTAKVYLGYEYADSGDAASANSTVKGTRTTTSIGLQKSF